MYRELFIKDFSRLGELLLNITSEVNGRNLLSDAIEDSFRENPLFARELQLNAIRSIAITYLSEEALRKWTEGYKSQISKSSSVVSVIMAGNIPLVGFHDMLTVLACGRRAEIKLSSKDRYLLPAIVTLLSDINSYWNDRIDFCSFAGENSKIVIATGGDQSVTIFSEMFKEVPSIIRGSRSSIAVLSGKESHDDIERLAMDMFLYYGRGCRSVSTIMLPVGSCAGKLAKELSLISPFSDDEAFMDNCRYQRALATVSGEWFLDGGFFIFKNATTFPPPMGVIGIVWYSSTSDIDNFIENNKESIQCIVNYETSKGMIKYGYAQMPSLSDYADGINSLEFILKNS